MSLTVRCCALNADQGPHFSILADQGFAVLPGNRAHSFWNAKNLIQDLTGCCAVVAGSEPYTAEVIEACPELRVIARTGVGFDAIDLEACNRRGVVVTTTPGVNHHSVAELAIAMLMGISRGFPQDDRSVRLGDWQRIARPRVMGRTLGLIGLGRIGQAVATRAVGLGMRVVAYEPYPVQEFVEKWNIELLDLNDLLAQSDYVSIHSPVTPETRKMMNADRFAKMKPGSVFINTARGGLVDESALVDALQSGHLRGAGLDVFEVEPLPTTSPLITMPNVLLTPHVAGLDIESQFDTLTMVAETIVALKNGGWPTECIQNLRGVTNWTWDR